MQVGFGRKDELRSPSVSSSVSLESVTSKPVVAEEIAVARVEGCKRSSEVKHLFSMQERPQHCQ